jgi:uncharacterized membrane protein
VVVSEGGRRYRPGASAELGSSGAPDTFGTTQTDQGFRIVWHYQASSEERTFIVHYRLRGLAVAYDDVVDVNLRVWGDQWEQRLEQLTASLGAPTDVQRAWGHPVSVRGDITIDGDLVTLRAIDIPPKQFVELRALIPRSGFTSTAGMKVESGNALDRIAADELEDARAYEADRARLDDALENPLRSLLVLLALAFLPALGVVALVWRLWGRERRTRYDREYEQEPPTETRPALCRRCSPRAAPPGPSSSRRRSST